MKVTYMISAPHCPWNNIDRQENCPGGRIVKIIGSGGSTPPLGTREHLKITAMKVNRNYRFVLTVVKNGETVDQENRTGEFMFESECHYYCEKEILSCIKDAAKRNDLGVYYEHTYCIYKETKPVKQTETREEDGKTITVTRELPTTALLVEVITVDENGINIR